MSIDEQIADAVHTAVHRATQSELIPLIRELLDTAQPAPLVVNSAEAARMLGTGLDRLRDHEARGLRIVPGTERRKLYRVVEIERYLDAIAPVEPTGLRSVS